MATGIVSIAALDHGFQGISDVLVVISVALFAVLMIAAMVRLRPDFGDLDAPLQLLTFVAACAVVGTRLSWWPLGVVGLLGWLLLMPMALLGDVAVSVDRASGPCARRLGTGQRRDVRPGDSRSGCRSRGSGDRSAGVGDLPVLRGDGSGALAGGARADGARPVPARRVDSDGRGRDRDPGGRSHLRGRRSRTFGR